jgi:hypothetical protein
MADVAAAFAVVTAALNLAAAAVGGLRWWRVQTSATFWILLRIAQVAAAAQALDAGVLAAAGFRPADGLYWLYALLPVAIGLVAEQLRAQSAQTVLDACGLESAQEVGRLDESGQRAIVLAILRREMGVMTLAAVVTVFLALRALGTV